MNWDQHFMKRAFELAAQGLSLVSPNPMVGCCIVHKNQIIGEGWHQKYGQDHAEVMALKQVKDKSLLPNASLYVNLEPCSHHGKTPPCAEKIIQEAVGHVVVSVPDINPLVSGQGIDMMQSAGIKVDVGCLKEDGERLNRRFFTFINKKRPYIILKWAQTMDNFIAKLNYESKWISNELSRKIVHKWRSEEDAILVGTNTAIYDNPHLTVRDWKGKSPIRILIDKSLKLDKSYNLFDQSNLTICYNLIKSEINHNIEYVQLPENNFISCLLEDLFKRKILSIMVEGGSKLLNSFIQSNTWDEARIFTSKKEFSNGIQSPSIQNQLIYESYDIGGDQLTIYENANHVND